MCRNVSTIFSVTSSGICTSLLFCRFSVSNEFKFSKTTGGNILILANRKKETSPLWKIKWREREREKRIKQNCTRGEISIRLNREIIGNYKFFWRLRNVMESPYPVKASSESAVMLLAFKSRWRNRCRRRNASLGTECKLLSPSRKYCRFSVMELK